LLGEYRPHQSVQRSPLCLLRKRQPVKAPVVELPQRDILHVILHVILRRILQHVIALGGYGILRVIPGVEDILEVILDGILRARERDCGGRGHRSGRTVRDRGAKHVAVVDVVGVVVGVDAVGVVGGVVIVVVSPLGLVQCVHSQCQRRGDSESREPTLRGGCQ